MRTILDNIKNKIQKLDNTKKFLLVLGSGIESFFLGLLLKDHFKKNLHCVLINNIYIDEKELTEIMYQYYNSGIKNICINSREYFYKSYIMKEDKELDSELIIKFNNIINNYKKYIHDEIEYFSFAFINSNLSLQNKLNIEGKISFEPFKEKDIEDIIILYSIFIQDKDQDEFFIQRKDYWDSLLHD
jgi:hypothetical protein